MKQKQYLDSSVQWSTGKCVIILWVESHLHDIVRVALKDLSTIPAFVPIPELYEHVIRWWKHIWKCGMNRYTADVVSVSLKLLYFIHGVVIVYPDKHIIWTSHDPLLARYEFCWSHWKLYRQQNLVQETLSPYVIWITGFHSGLWMFIQNYQLAASKPRSKHPTGSIPKPLCTNKILNKHGEVLHL